MSEARFKLPGSISLCEELRRCVLMVMGSVPDSVTREIVMVVRGHDATTITAKEFADEVMRPVLAALGVLVNHDRQSRCRDAMLARLVPDEELRVKVVKYLG